MSAVLDLMPLQWMTAVMLLSLRVGAMLLTTPFFSAADVPVRVRVLVVVGLSASLCVALGVTGEPWGLQADALRTLTDHPLRLVRSACDEVALGIVLALPIHAAFAAFAVAGQLLDVQLGFGLSQVFNPASDTMTPVLSTALSRIAVIMFFLTNGHHAVIRAMAFSLERMPLGRPWALEATLPVLVGSVAGLFGLCVALVAPVIFCILLTEMALGVIARNLPQVNMLTMGIPVKIVVGLAALSIWFMGIGGAMDRVYRGLYQALDAAIGAAPVPPGRMV